MTPGINTLLLSTGALGSFTCSGMTLLIYMGPTALHGIRAIGDTLSNIESQVFTPYKFGSTAGDRTPDLLTTRPTGLNVNRTFHLSCLCSCASPSSKSGKEEPFFISLRSSTPQITYARLPQRTRIIRLGMSLPLHIYSGDLRPAYKFNKSKILPQICERIIY